MTAVMFKSAAARASTIKVGLGCGIVRLKKKWINGEMEKRIERRKRMDDVPEEVMRD